MNSHRTTSPPPDRGVPELDARLRDFFRAELPDPWPAAPAVEERHTVAAAPARPRRWAQRQFALAAAVGLFLVGYWALSMSFPPAPRPGPTRTDGFAPVREGVMAKQPGKLKNQIRLDRQDPIVLPAPSGQGQVEIREQRLPEGRILMRLELIEGRGR